MKSKVLYLLLFTVLGLSLGSSQVLAVDAPDFPSCSNPQGVIKAQYNDGTHGIVGNSGQYSGSDTVYQLDNGNLIQCFCSADGQGIQTNWWKISSLTDDQLQVLKNDGWNYIPNGALWGLEEAPYMAKNSNYSCLSNNSSSNNSGNSGSSGGEVLGASTSIGQVLGLASTGGSFLPWAFAILGTITLLSGLLLYKKASKK